MATTILKAAHALADRGYYVSPVRKNKIPYKGTHGFNDATLDKDEIDRMFFKRPDAQISIATGPSGLLVFDTDCKDGKPGYENRAHLVEKHGELPKTVEANTPSGGYHQYFIGQSPSTTDEIALGLDIRSQGGCVLCPPSQGKNGSYTWVTSLLENDPAPVPAWLLELARTPLSSSTTSGQSTGKGRNVELTKIAGSLARNGVSGDSLGIALLAINKDKFNPPLEDWEVLKIAASINRRANNTGNRETNDLDLARSVAMSLRGAYAYDVITKNWMGYEGDRGIWARKDQDMMFGPIGDEIKARNGEPNLHKIRNVEQLMRADLAHNFGDTSREFLPMANGVLNLNTKEMRPHCAENYLTWFVPYAYDPHAECSSTRNWLFEAMGEQSEYVEMLQAYLRAIIFGRADLQIFLELFGPGASGKGTYTRLAQCLVGPENSHPTDLKTLENDKFEMANLYGKRLMVINEADAYAGTVNKLKMLTGGDSMRYEKKFKDANPGGFVFEGMIITTANQLLRSADLTSGFFRRRLTVPFRKPSNQDRDLLRIYSGKPIGELATELPGILNWILDMSETRMMELLSRAGRRQEHVRETRQEVILETNTIAAWAQDHLVFAPGEKLSLQQLYSNYTDWCEQQGNKAFGQGVFSRNLIELATEEYRLSGVVKQRKNIGFIITNVRWRTQDDTDEMAFGPALHV